MAGLPRSDRVTFTEGIRRGEGDDKAFVGLKEEFWLNSLIDIEKQLGELTNKVTLMKWCVLGQEERGLGLCGLG